MSNYADIKLPRYAPKNQFLHINLGPCHKSFQNPLIKTKSGFTLCQCNIPHSGCLISGVDYSPFIANETAEVLLAPLLRQLNFWC